MEDTFTLNAEGIPTIPLVVGGELDYTFDWTDWLAAIDKQLASYELDVPAGLVKLTDSRDGGAITVDLRAVRAGYNVPVTCKIVTSGPRAHTDARTIIIEVRARR